jgi:hypothetical protein
VSEHKATWQFLRRFVSDLDPVLRGAGAVAMAITVLTAAWLPVLEGWPVHGWHAVLSGAVSLLAWSSMVWAALGSRRFQRWVGAGDDPSGPGA